MNSAELIESLAEFARAKNIDSSLIVELLDEVFRSMIRRSFGSDENFDVTIKYETGDLEMLRHRLVVPDDSPDVKEPDKISLSDAIKIEPDFEVGEEVSDVVKLEDFGRRAILTARQTLIQRVKDLEKNSLYLHYKNLMDEIIVGEVNQVMNREVLVLDGEGNELILPKSEQISKDRFRKGDSIRAVVHSVEMYNSTPRIIISRTSPKFLEKLFENEIPEIYDGLITIKKVIREPGERAKVAVESYDDRIDPVGACVGIKGSRIHSIVRELNNENIDIINFTDNLDLYISRALSPAKISKIEVGKNDRVSVFLKPDQVSLAIGKGGHNIKLASKLVGYEIDVFRDAPDFDDEEDIDLAEFEEDLEPWILEELSRIGLDTAKSILNLGKEELLKRSDLEEETIDFLLEILRKEFE